MKGRVGGVNCDVNDPGSSPGQAFVIWMMVYEPPASRFAKRGGDAGMPRARVSLARAPFAGRRGLVSWGGMLGFGSRVG